MSFIMWMVNAAWKLLLIGLGFYVFRFILKNGPGTLKEVVQTASAGVKVMCYAAREKMKAYLIGKEQEKMDAVEAEEPTAVEAEGSVR